MATPFAHLAAYRGFLDEVVGRANARRHRAAEAERAALQSLPARRTTDHDEALVTVTRSGGFILRRLRVPASSFSRESDSNPRLTI